MIILIITMKMGNFLTKIGCKWQIIQKRKIEDNIVVSAGGLVLRNLTKVGTYVGNPVQLIN